MRWRGFDLRHRLGVACRRALRTISASGRQQPFPFRPGFSSATAPSTFSAGPRLDFCIYRFLFLYHQKPACPSSRTRRCPAPRFPCRPAPSGRHLGGGFARLPAAPGICPQSAGSAIPRRMTHRSRVVRSFRCPEAFGPLAGRAREGRRPSRPRAQVFRKSSIAPCGAFA